MSKATSCKDAIKAWAAKTGQKPEEAEVIKLFYQFPLLSEWTRPSQPLRAVFIFP